MMKKYARLNGARLARPILAFVFAAAYVGGSAPSAWAASSKKRSKSKSKSVDPDSLMHGPDIWGQVEAKLERERDGRFRYGENVQSVPVEWENPRNMKKAVVTQTSSAPDWTDGGPDALTYPLVMEDVVDGFLEHFENALPILGIGGKASREQGEERQVGHDLTPEGLEDLKDVSEGLLVHSRELVKIYGRLSREQRVSGEGRLKIDPELQRGRVEESVLAATQEWLEVVERIETSAVRFRRGALMRSPERLRKAWKALVAAGLELPQFRSSIQALIVERERGKPSTVEPDRDSERGR